MWLGRFIMHTMFGRGAADYGAVLTHTSAKKGQSRDELGGVEIPAPRTYAVTSGPESPDAVEPQILLGS